MTRAVSTASIAMPPPSKIPSTRPPSVLAVSSTSSNIANQEANESRPSSPKSKGARKPSVTVVNANGTKTKTDGANDNGEINIQVVVRCRYVVRVVYR
jgi:kinesin family protein 11